MQGINRLIAVALIVHVTLFVSTIFLTNALQEMPYFGGNSGFLPSTGNSSEPYDRFSNWISGNQGGMSEPSDQGGIAILQWIVRGPLCSSVSIVKFLIALTVLKYGVIDLISSDGFGLWFKTAVHLVGGLMNIALVSILVRFAIQAGVFSNIYLMAALGLMSVIGIVASLLNAGGAFSCG